MRVTVPCELMSVNVALVSLLTCKRSRVMVYNMEYFYITIITHQISQYDEYHVTY